MQPIKASEPNAALWRALMEAKERRNALEG